MAATAVWGAGGARATWDADGLPYSPGFNGCYFHGTTYYTDEHAWPDVNYTDATTTAQYSSACNQMKMYVALNFVGCDYAWHYYPLGPLWVGDVGHQMTVWETYWTNHSRGAHQMYDVYGCNCVSTNYITDTNN